jgi:hypothetical protein
MLREIVVEEEIPGNLQTTFRLRVDGNVIAENVTELESQFLVSEMIERIPSLRSASKRRRPSSPKAIAPPCRLEAAGGRSTNERSNGGSLYVQPPAALCESQAERRNASW